MIDFGWMYWSMNRIWWFTASFVPAAPHAANMASHWAIETAIGFSQRTWLAPRAAARQVSSAWLGAVVATIVLIVGTLAAVAIAIDRRALPDALGTQKSPIIMCAFSRVTTAHSARKIKW